MGEIDNASIYKRDAKLDEANSFQGKVNLTFGVETENVLKMAILSIPIKALQLLMVITPNLLTHSLGRIFGTSCHSLLALCLL